MAHIVEPNTRKGAFLASGVCGCDSFDSSIARTNTQTNDIWHIDGHVDVRCRFLDGGSLSGTVEFCNCH